MTAKQRRLDDPRWSSQTNLEEHTQERDGSDGRGTFPSTGMAGKIEQAQKASSPGVSSDQVLAVARKAYEEGRHAADVWAEYGGGET